MSESARGPVAETTSQNWRRTPAAVGRDLRHALRSIAASPGFAVTVVATLAIGIGATTAIFSVVRGLLLRPLPGISRPQELVEIGRSNRGQGFDTCTYPDFVDFRRQATSFSGILAFEVAPVNVRVGDESQRAMAFVVSSNYFDLLGVTPALGGVFPAGRDDAAERAPIAVLSHAYWRRVLGGRRDAVGSPLWVNGKPVTVVGVAPESFRGHVAGAAPDLWLPLGAEGVVRPGRGDVLAQRGSFWLMLTGRLQPGVTIAAAQAELETIAARIAAAYPDSHRDVSVRLAPYGPVPAELRSPATAFSLLLLGLVALVLVVAATNAASLLLARSESRGKEFAIRRALGAGRGAVARQVLVESVSLYVLAVPPALLIARWGTSALAAARPPGPFEIRLDFPVDAAAFAFSLLVALAFGVLFGLAPALNAARQAPQSVLRGVASSGRVRRLRLREAMVVAQLAVSLVLLTTTALLLRALSSAAAIDVGFDVRRVTTFALAFDLAGFAEPEGARAQDDLVARLAALPGVESAAFAATVPLNFESIGLGGVAAAGVEAPPEGLDTDANVVSPGYFACLGVPVRGRTFDARDGRDAPGVAVINAALAKMLWGDADPLGRSLVLDPARDRRSLQVVGVVPDGRYRRLGAAGRPTLFVPAAQVYMRSGYALYRARGSAGPSPAEVDAVLHAIGPDFPRPQLVPMTEIAAISTLPQRIAAAVAGGCGIVALLLAVVGLYGVQAYAVAQRTREIAIRVAVGARRGQIGELVLRSASRTVVAGAALGLAGAAALAHALGSLLFGVGPLDPLAFAGAAALLTVVTVAAALVPAAQAAAIEPMRALRTE
jgi:putative ABC transport system permease protein